MGPEAFKVSVATSCCKGSGRLALLKISSHAALSSSTLPPGPSPAAVVTFATLSQANAAQSFCLAAHLQHRGLQQVTLLPASAAAAGS